MSTADCHAEPFLRALERSEDPWREPARTTEPARPAHNWGRIAALHGVAGLWGVVLGTAFWWSYTFATASGPALALAQVP